MYALNAASGELIWKYTTGGPVETGIVLKSSLSVAHDELFFGSDDGYVCVLLHNWTTLLIRD